MNKNPSNKWKKGQCGNPKGRPKVFGEIKEFARQFMKEKGFQGLLDLLESTNQDAVKARIYETIMAYGYGKPSQKLEVEGNLDTNANINITALPIDKLKQIRDILKDANTNAGPSK